MDLINKTVKTIEGSIDNSGIIPFMYPNFLVKDEIFFDYENSIIYTGKYSKDLKKELEHGTKEFIAICNIGMSDIDFTQRDTIIDCLYSKWNRKTSESTKEVLNNMTELDFWTFFKKYWVAGKSTIENREGSIFDLYKVLGKQRHDVLTEYFKLSEIYSDSIIFSSVLSFIEKSLNPDLVTSQNGNYIKLLNDFRSTFGSAIIPIIQRVYQMPCKLKSDKQYRTLWLLTQLGRGGV